MTFRRPPKMAGSSLVSMILFIIIFEYLTEAKNIQEGCGPYSVIVQKNVTYRCYPCPMCPPGYGLSIKCGSFITDLNKLTCRSCSKGTYSDRLSRDPCSPCRSCEDGLKVKRNCTPTQDTHCIHCKRGFYYSELIRDCLPCSRCCKDGKDDKIDECTNQQGPQNGKFCSISSFHRCHQTTNYSLGDENVIDKSSDKRIDFTTLKSTSRNISLNTSSNDHRKGIFNRTTVENYSTENTREIYVLLVTSVFIFSQLVIIIFLINVIRRRKSNNNLKGECLPLMRLSNRKYKQNAHMCKGDQSDELEDWSNNDITSGIYSFKCGVTIQYVQNCIEDKSKNLVVETLNDDFYSKAIKPGCIVLSPIYRFYSKGEKFKNPVKISIPHSAHWTSDQNTWEIYILCMDERKRDERKRDGTKWERVKTDVKINRKDASFRCDTLLTYVVVGRPLTGAKKRMQFVVFAPNKMITDLFEVVLYLLDDNETSFERVLKENKSKGFSMLGYFYAAFVHLFSPVDITINVQNLLPGWEMYDDRSSSKTICSSDCADSYFKIPRLKTEFRRTKRQTEKFKCQFSVDIAGSKTIIPVFAFLPEKAAELLVKVDIHEKDHSPINENTNLFKDLSWEVLEKMSFLLDKPVQGQTSRRKVGRYFGLDEEVKLISAVATSNESATLFDCLRAKLPAMTVREFAECLRSIGREDVMSVVYEHSIKN